MKTWRQLEGCLHHLKEYQELQGQWQILESEAPQPNLTLDQSRVLSLWKNPGLLSVLGPLTEEGNLHISQVPGTKWRCFYNLEPFGSFFATSL